MLLSKVDRKALAEQIQKYLVNKYNDCPVSTLTLDGKFEVHTGGWREKLPNDGFIFIKDGYFSSIWEIPQNIKDTK